MPSFYCPDLNQQTTNLRIEKDEFHHLAHVFRAKPGDSIKLNSGYGVIGIGVIEAIHKTYADIIVNQTTDYQQNKVPYAIAFSLLKNKNDELLIEKTTELGVHSLFPFVSEYSIRKPSNNSLVRFQSTALSAIKQCDNPYLPTIYNIMDLTKAIEFIISCGYSIVIASEHKPEAKIIDLAQGLSYCFVIGPEGGFSKEEFSLFKRYKLAEVTVSNMTLRAETAAIAIAAQQNLFN